MGHSPKIICVQSRARALHDEFKRECAQYPTIPAPSARFLEHPLWRSSGCLARLYVAFSAGSSGTSTRALMSSSSQAESSGFWLGTSGFAATSAATETHTLSRRSILESCLFRPRGGKKSGPPRVVFFPGHATVLGASAACGMGQLVLHVENGLLAMFNLLCETSAAILN